MTLGASMVGALFAYNLGMQYVGTNDRYKRAAMDSAAAVTALAVPLYYNSLPQNNFAFLTAWGLSVLAGTAVVGGHPIVAAGLALVTTTGVAHMRKMPQVTVKIEDISIETPQSNSTNSSEVPDVSPTAMVNTTNTTERSPITITSSRVSPVRIPSVTNSSGVPPPLVISNVTNSSNVPPVVPNVTTTIRTPLLEQVVSFWKNVYTSTTSVMKTVYTGAKDTVVYLMPKTTISPVQSSNKIIIGNITIDEDVLPDLNVKSRTSDSTTTSKSAIGNVTVDEDVIPDLNIGNKK
jgi:hypothetical protein